MQVQSNQIKRQFDLKAKEYFAGLRFEPTKHEYFVEDKKVPKSVSGLVKGFVVPTDFDKIAANIDRRDNLPPGTTKAIWAEKNRIACEGGTDTHDYGESKYKDQNQIADTKKKQAIDRFWQKLNTEHPGRYFIVAVETRMYHKKYFFSGTNDVTLYDRLTNTYIIVDYKTNEDLFKNFNGNTLADPFSQILDCPYNHYQIQLSFYEILMIQLGLTVSERWIVWLLPDGEPELYKAHDFSGILINYLEDRLHA